MTHEEVAGGPSRGGGHPRQAVLSHRLLQTTRKTLGFTLNELRKDTSSSSHLLNLRGDILIITLFGGSLSFFFFFFWWEFSSQVMSGSLRPHDYSPPGSSVHGISQARILEWVAISFPGSSQSRDQTQVSCLADSLPVSHLGSPITLKGVTFP